MKYLGLVAAIFFAMALAACGDDASSEESGAEAAKPTRPDVEFPSGPPPKELVANDLEEGSGPPAEPGDEVTVHYAGVDDKGRQLFSSWGNYEPMTFELGAGNYSRGWEQGIEGMRVGGRREVLIPADLSYGGANLFYVIDLLSIK